MNGITSADIEAILLHSNIEIIPEGLKENKPKEEINTSGSKQDAILFTNPLSITSDRLTHGSDLFHSIQCNLCSFLCLDPVYMTCCDFIYCKHCISLWLTKDKTCPKCKFPEAKFDNLTKFMNKIFNNIRIVCKYYREDGGCKEKMLYHSAILKHENFCEFNPNAYRKCDKCHLVFERNRLDLHDCVKELVKYYEKTERELREMKAKIEKESQDEMTSYLKHSLKIHTHPLMRTKIREDWKCSTCATRYESKDLTYTCFSCELNICPKCFNHSVGKEGDTSIHQHNLVFKKPHGGWTCDLCKGSYAYRSFSFRCDACDFDQCFKCRFKK